MAARRSADRPEGAPPTGDGDPAARPETAGEALALAMSHARVAARESLAALRALLDAAALATTGSDSEASRLLAPIAQVLERLGEEIDEGRDAASVLEAIGDALDVEIERWQARARDDVEARAVLRAFLSLREVLWEFGVGRGPAAESGRPRPAPRKAGPRRRPSRVQRVRVDGS